jgi:hypothetical protein
LCKDSRSRLSSRAKLDGRDLWQLRVARDMNHRMTEIEQVQIGELGSGLDSKPPRKVSRLLLLWPLGGMIALVFAVIKFPPLDDILILWSGGILCILVAALINIAWYYPDVRRFFPRKVWLAVGCLFVPMALLVNGALDRSPVEQRHQIVTRTILEHGSKTADNLYYLELTSWRAGRTHEKVMVSERWYLTAKPGDPVIVETRKGALGISLLLSVHKPD